MTAAATTPQATFAAMVGVNKSAVHRAIQSGRLPATGEEGDPARQVRFDPALGEEAALALWDLTGSSQPHHRARMVQIREEKAQRQAMRDAANSTQDPEAAKKAQATMEALNLRLKQAETEKREHEAEKARMEREMMAKNLLQREAVEYGLRDFTNRMAALFDNAPDQWSPELHALQTVEEVRSHLAEHFDRLRLEMANHMAQAGRLAREEEAA